MERVRDGEDEITHGSVFRSSISYRMRRIWPVPILGLLLYLMMFPFYLLFFTIADSYIYLLCMSPLIVGYVLVFIFRSQFYFTIRPPVITFEKDHIRLPASESFERPFVYVGYGRLIRLELVPKDPHSGGLKIFRYGKYRLGLGPEISSIDEVDIDGMERVIIHYRSRNVSGSSSVEVKKEFFGSEEDFLEFVNMMMHIVKGGRRRPK
ncbi:MAG: hypothetical protein ACMUHB_01200 [Thermoplasmatota archaeon]